MNKNILLIPRVEIHNANALSSPYTIGFPAMTAWLGVMHALERKLRNPDKAAYRYFEEHEYEDELDDVRFNTVAVVCHDIRLHTYRGENDFISSIVGTGNPLDKSGNRSSFIEEARCELTVSLLIEYDMDDSSNLAKAVAYLLHRGIKMAGGDVIRFRQPDRIKVTNESELKTLMGRVMPGHCLVERNDLMQTAMQEGMDAIDALLEYLKVNYSCTVADDEVAWSKGFRREKGWIVPIATGFHGISALGHAEQQRDQDTPHRFVESVVTLGEFIMPYRINDPDQILWHYHYDPEHQLYSCRTNKPYSESKEITHG